VALDRDSIVRSDFPTVRRGGYDPAAVRAHLDALAREVAAREAPTLSAQASEQVKAIVEAAERGAQEVRANAVTEAREHVAHVAEAADRLRARIEQMESDVTRLVVELRDNAQRLHDDLAALEAGVGTLRRAAGAAPPPPAEAPEPAAAGDTAPEAGSTPPATGGETAPEAGSTPPATAAADAAAARIVALDMALSGKSREETERYLAEHYELEDRAGLLDEVYAAAGA
jgi:DivIVA domain-containing protein